MVETARRDLSSEPHPAPSQWQWYKVPTRRIEDTLFDLIIQRRVLKLKVSRERIQAKARELAHAEGHENFVASDKGLSLFMKHYDLSLRRTTNLTDLSNEELVSRALSYMIFLSSRRSTLDPMRTVLGTLNVVIEPEVDHMLPFASVAALVMEHVHSRIAST